MARGARCRARHERLRHLLRRARRRRGARRLADVRAQPPDVHRGSQFAFVGVFAAGGLAALPSAIASAALLGVRNVAYGMRMSPLIGADRHGERPPRTSPSTSPPPWRSRRTIRACAGWASGSRGRHLPRLEPHHPRRRAGRRRARRPEGLGAGCRGGCGLPRPAVAASASAAGRRRRDRGRRDRGSPHAVPHAGAPGARRRCRRDRRRVVQLAGDTASRERRRRGGGA